jgi:hypothetical protein
MYNNDDCWKRCWILEKKKKQTNKGVIDFQVFWSGSNDVRYHIGIGRPSLRHNAISRWVINRTWYRRPLIRENKSGYRLFLFLECPPRIRVTCCHSTWRQRGFEDKFTQPLNCLFFLFFLFLFFFLFLQERWNIIVFYMRHSWSWIYLYINAYISLDYFWHDIRTVVCIRTLSKLDS